MKRVEDPVQLLGRATFVDDIKFQGMLYCFIVRSPYPKAKIKSVKKPDDPRLVDFLDGQELAKIAKPYNKFESGEKKFELHSLAVGEVHYVGEPVAAVLARSRYDAEDLAEEVQVEYDVLEPVVDANSGLHGSSKAIDSWTDNIAFEKSVASGDFQRALSESAHSFVIETTISRQAAIPIENRGNVSIFDPQSKELTIWTPTKGPHTTRAGAAQVFTFEEHSVHVKVPSIGGGFGVKAYYYPEEVVAGAFAIRNNPRPVKWISTRTEDLESTLQARDQSHKTTICFDRDLRITGLRDEFVVDIGTPGSLSSSPSLRMVPLIGGCYKIPNISVSYKGVATNKPPMGPIRGNGRPEALLITERAIEHAARKLGVDPVELRRRNLIRSSEMPYNNHIGSVYDSGDYGEALSRVVESSGYLKLKEWKKSELERNGRVIGIGLASYVEDTGGPPGKGGRPQYETAFVRVERDGSVSAYSGSSPHGQGHESTFAQVIARELCIDVGRVRVRFGDTALIPYGVGSMGSRSGLAGGSAMLLASREIKQKMTSIAAALLGSKPSEIRQTPDGGFAIEGSSRSVSFDEVARSAYEQRRETAGLGLGLSAEVFFEPPALTYAFGAMVAVVEVDRSSGRPALLEIFALDDSGRVIDREIVEGQVEGGIVHGIGNALLEEIGYNEDGQPLATNLLDYLIPTSMDVPPMKLIEMETPSALNPLGVKGAGEGGTIGALPAVINAISDALGETITYVPVRLEETLKILRAMEKAQLAPSATAH